MSDTQFLVNEMKTFFDQGNYDNEQLANVSALMDSICRLQGNSQYEVSVGINVSLYEDPVRGKENRCNAIEQAMDAMYHVFRRTALNRSEPLDFSSIQFYSNATDRSSTYNLTDLINVSWIHSSIEVEAVCKITDPIKEYVAMRSSNATVQVRADAPLRGGPVSALVELMNRWLDPILGLRRRLYWESSNRLSQIQTRLSSGMGSVRDAIGSSLGRTRERLFGSLTNATRSSASELPTNSTNAFNSTLTGPLRPVSSGAGQKALVNASSSTPAPYKLSTSTSTSISMNDLGKLTTTPAPNSTNTI